MKINPPLISVIIPTYNRRNLVLRAIRSVLKQTFQAFEIIVVDDGSTDNTLNSLQAYVDDRIKLLRHEENLGSPSARNTGISVAKGQYIAFLDSDDEWHPEKLEKQLALFETSDLENLGAVNCGLIVDSGSTRPLQVWHPSSRGRVYWTYLQRREYHDTASMWLIRKKYLEELDGPFDARLLYLQVSDLLVRLAKLCEFDYVQEPLLTYHNHAVDPRNELYPLNIQRDAFEHYFEKHISDLQKRPDIYCHLLETLGTRYLRLGLSKEAKNYFLKAIKRNPISGKAWLLLILTSANGRFYNEVRKLRFMLTKGRLRQHGMVQKDQSFATRTTEPLI